MMHVPKQRMTCWAAEARPRRWLWGDLREKFKGRRWVFALPEPKDEARNCRAWVDLAHLRSINGFVCDDCARLPAETFATTSEDVVDTSDAIDLQGGAGI